MVFQKGDLVQLTYGRNLKPARRYGIVMFDRHPLSYVDVCWLPEQEITPAHRSRLVKVEK